MARGKQSKKQSPVREHARASPTSEDSVEHSGQDSVHDLERRGGVRERGAGLGRSLPPEAGSRKRRAKWGLPTGNRQLALPRCPDDPLERSQPYWAGDVWSGGGVRAGNANNVPKKVLRNTPDGN